LKNNFILNINIPGFNFVHNPSQTNSGGVVWHSDLPFWTIPQEHGLIWWEMSKARPSLHLRNFDAPDIARLYPQFEHEMYLYSLMVLLI